MIGFPFHIYDCRHESCVAGLVYPNDCFGTPWLQFFPRVCLFSLAAFRVSSSLVRVCVCLCWGHRSFLSWFLASPANLTCVLLSADLPASGPLNMCFLCLGSPAFISHRVSSSTARLLQPAPLPSALLQPASHITRHKPFPYRLHILGPKKQTEPKPLESLRNTKYEFWIGYNSKPLMSSLINLSRS